MGFAAAALALAAIGIYGVISYSVGRRTPEIRIRLALGISGSIALPSLLASLLYGVSPNDPWTYAGASVVLLLVAFAAGFIPALRASRISPMAALRTE